MARRSHEPDPIRSGARIGRYTVLEILGTGGMGSVFAAYDPVLDRRVALKLLHGHADDARLHARLRTEAQAMAQLSHPHVVSVFEVGVHEGRVFVAMEFVDGPTLRTWLSDEHPPWRRIVAIFRRAGAGLSAAHDAGIVHGDFKPDNVLVGADGRARVVDFGLAGASQPRATDPPAPAPGTPAYMAPEQFLGKGLDARADQFAFCVALWEALYGERPFAGRTRLELAAAVVEGRRRSAPEGARIPRWLHDVLVRGLSVDPAARHPSMEALLHALDHNPARWHRVAYGLGVPLVGGIAVFVAVSGEPSQCSDSEDRLAPTWTDARRSSVHDALASTRGPLAEQHATHAVAALDRYATRWVQQHEQACEASVHGEQSGEVLDQRVRCLSAALERFGALVDVLENADDTATANAAEATDALPPPERCRDLALLSAALAPPTDEATRLEVEAIHAAIARIDAEVRAGHSETARTAAEALWAESADVDYPAALAEIELARGEANDLAGAPREAEANLTDAYFIALAAGADDTATKAATKLAYVVGYELLRDEDGMHWGEHARALGERAGVDPERRTALALGLGTIHLAHGRPDAAERETTAALEVLRTLPGTELRIAAALGILGKVALDRQRYDDADRYFSEALERYEERLGPGHLAVARTLDARGTTAWLRGDYETAAQLQDRALAVREAALGDEHPEVVSSLLNIAGTAMARDDLDRARDVLQRAIAILQQDDNPLPMLGEAVHNLAVVQRARGELAVAERTERRALDLQIDARGPDDIGVGRSHANLGWILDEQGDAAAALPHFTRALAIRQTVGASAGDIASTRFGLARAQTAAGRDGLETARTALAEAQAAGDAERGLADDIAAWIDEQSGSGAMISGRDQ